MERSQRAEDTELGASHRKRSSTQQATAVVHGVRMECIVRVSLRTRGPRYALTLPPASARDRFAQLTEVAVGVRDHVRKNLPR